VRHLQQQGESRAYLYGTPNDGHTEAIGGLNAFFLLLDRPEVYRLPNRPTLPSRNNLPGWLSGWVSGLLALFMGGLAFRKHRFDERAERQSPAEQKA
jgi:formate dehydrogenase iron-sulfur subunit